MRPPNRLDASSSYHLVSQTYELVGCSEAGDPTADDADLLAPAVAVSAEVLRMFVCGDEIEPVVGSDRVEVRGVAAERAVGPRSSAVGGHLSIYIESDGSREWSLPLVELRCESGAASRTMARSFSP